MGRAVFGDGRLAVAPFVPSPEARELSESRLLLGVGRSTCSGSGPPVGAAPCVLVGGGCGRGGRSATPCPLGSTVGSERCLRDVRGATAGGALERSAGCLGPGRAIPTGSVLGRQARLRSAPAAGGPFAETSVLPGAAIYPETMTRFTRWEPGPRVTLCGAASRRGGACPPLPGGIPSSRQRMGLGSKLARERAASRKAEPLRL